MSSTGVSRWLWWLAAKITGPSQAGEAVEAVALGRAERGHGGAHHALERAARRAQRAGKRRAQSVS